MLQTWPSSTASFSALNASLWYSHSIPILFQYCTVIYQVSVLDSQSFPSEETEGECCAAAASILRGDYGPGGCDDIMGESIFGGDMGHWWWWWWWWWWCVSTWGFPSEWGRTRSKDKKYIYISEGITGLTPSRRPFCGRSQSFVQTVITPTRAYLKRPYLSPPQPLFPTVEPPAVTLWQQRSNQWENNFLEQGQEAVS